ncbi:MAG: cyclic nucleotide-binding domain-containing protein [Fibrobacteres bacterium]|nr:cyclic nucleotide-binding domain-containing protein [Fibrobacterota bacterium]
MVQIREYAPGELIISENDAGEAAYYIDSGKVAVFKIAPGGQIHIAHLGPGDIFGEMSMVDDSPRSASVRAIEATTTREFHRDDLYAAIRENPAIFATFMKSIFNRLREANRIIATMPIRAGQVSTTANLKDDEYKDAKFSIEGLTPEAMAAIPNNPFPIKGFPFKIGRKSNDPFVYNHLELIDGEPAQIARHHVALVFDGMHLGVVDRGSELGASVDGVRIGGRNGAGPVYFNGKEGILVLGSEGSPYSYKIKVVW